MEKEQIVEDIKRNVLIKLVAHRYWQHKHTNINNLPKGLPSHLRSSKFVRKAIDELIKNGFLFTKPTNYGLEISLNITKKREICEFIEKRSF